MLELLHFFLVRHEPWLVVLAAVLCCVGAVTSLRLTRLALAGRNVVKVAWTFLAALIAGTAIWTTHFVALLAYRAPSEITYDATLTILSLLIAIAGAYGAFSLVTFERRGVLPALGGALLGLVVAEMHYVGMAGYQVHEMTRWDSRLAIGSLAATSLLTAASMATLRGQFGLRFGYKTAAGILVAAILGVHFAGMGALHVLPAGDTQIASHHGSPTLALAATFAAALIIAAGGFAYVIDWRVRDEARQRIDAIATCDSLTGLANGAAFNAHVGQRVAAVRPGESFAIIAMQIANLNVINQRYGGRITDLVIEAIAQRLTAARKPGVFLARSASSQFCGIGVVLDRADTLDRSQKLHAALSRDVLVEGIEIPVDIRIGSATFPDDADSAESLTRRAQTAMARALADPLTQIVQHDETVDASTQRRLAITSDLRGALARGEFTLVYQPQVWIADRRVIGYEALLRWNHPQFGEISPAEFIPIAERTGAILAIGAWVLRIACATAAGWEGGYRISVNVSPLQLRQRDLPELIHETLLNTGLSPGRLEIELTESLFVDDRASALHVLRRIKMLGVRLALDDFGTGYSSMDVLRQFPFDKVKLDKSFVDDVERNPQARAILHAMLALGRALSIPILVEGVESMRQLEILRREGCNKVQGFLTGRPVSAEQIGAEEMARKSA